MKKALFIFIILAVSGLVYTFVLGSPPAPSPLCQIEGTIQSVEFTEAYDAPCLKESTGCPTDLPQHSDAKYSLKIKVDSSSYVSGPTEFSTCDDLFPVNATNTISILKSETKSGESFTSGQKIKGQASWGFGNYFRSYELTQLSTNGSGMNLDNTNEGASKYWIYLIAVIVFLVVISYLIKKK